MDVSTTTFFDADFILGLWPHYEVLHGVTPVIVSFVYAVIALFNVANFCRLPTDIQAEAIPLILGGGDVLMVCPIHA